MAIKNLDKAALRLKDAVKNGERIILYGDADLDGACSAIIMQETLKTLGGNVVRVYFPDRENDGYGITLQALKELKTFSPGLVCAMDLGISNFKEIVKAKELGFDVMLVDHHVVLDKLPVADIIVDPKQERQPADEMVMVLNGIDTDFDTENNYYDANTIPFYYQHHPIQIKTNELIRIYVVNMVEFDPINNLHLHGNLYKYYPTGTDLVPSFYTDMITLSQTERGIMEFEYQYPGKYLFHAHKVEFSEKGWVGIFLVSDDDSDSEQETSSTTRDADEYETG